MTSMRTVGGPASTARSAGEEVARSAPYEWLARAGFVARGLIYGIIGILAIKLAIGVGGKTTNQQGALRTIAHQPFGKILMILVAIGLGGYALWRLIHAAIGHGPESSDSTFERIAALGSGVVYAGMCVLAVEFLRGGSAASTSGSSTPPKAAAGVLGWPAGVWLVGGAGVVMAGSPSTRAIAGSRRTSWTTRRPSR